MILPSFIRSFVHRAHGMHSPLLLLYFIGGSSSVPLYLPDILMLKVHRRPPFSFYIDSLPHIVQFHDFLCWTLNKMFRLNGSEIIIITLHILHMTLSQSIHIHYICYKGELYDT